MVLLKLSIPACKGLFPCTFTLIHAVIGQGLVLRKDIPIPIARLIETSTIWYFSALGILIVVSNKGHISHMLFKNIVMKLNKIFVKYVTRFKVVWELPVLRETINKNFKNYKFNSKSLYYTFLFFDISLVLSPL